MQQALAPKAPGIREGEDGEIVSGPATFFEFRATRVAPAGRSERFRVSSGYMNLFFRTQAVVLFLSFGPGFCDGSLAAEKLPAPKPVPQMQVVPLPNHEVSFQRDGIEIARYYFGPDLRRPFLFPIIGPSGRSLTRMGHPHEPESHSHHNSVWISHNDVNGVNFWEDHGKGQIVHQRIEKLDDGPKSASISVINVWAATNKVLLVEHRRVTAQALPKNEWLLILDLQLEATNGAVTMGKTPFGPIGVRMAKTIGVNDGGGMIRNSEGGVNEKEVLWKRARWVDYSGPIAAQAVEGLTLFDHPSNPDHPSFFHVRNDGWMGASLTFDAPVTIQTGQPLRLRYGLYVHAGQPEGEILQRRWESFARGMN
jgi:hypothetical protein